MQKCKITISAILLVCILASCGSQTPCQESASFIETMDDRQAEFRWVTGASVMQSTYLIDWIEAVGVAFVRTHVSDHALLEGMDRSHYDGYDLIDEDENITILILNADNKTPVALLDAQNATLLAGLIDNTVLPVHFETIRDNSHPPGNPAYEGRHHW